jgi:2-oxoglutarate dehydrogenase E2 component (dihydrolipoamide succinyltransferase)
MTTELKMPRLGESIVEGTVSRWLKQEGEAIEEYEPLLEVSTDKVVTEIPATAGGIVLKIMVPEGETVAVGTPLCLIGQAEEDEPQPPANSHQSMAAGESEKPHITPVVARIAAEHDLDINKLAGSGRGGRVTKKDILAYIERHKEAGTAPPEPAPAPASLPWDQPGSGDLFAPTEKIFASNREPEADPAPARPKPIPAPKPDPSPESRPGQIIPFSGMRKTIADHMLRSKQISPHVTTVMEADCSAIVNFCQKHGPEFERIEGIPLTYTPIFIAAIIAGLKAVPMANSTLTEKGIELKREINIGLAVALENGLIVPVIQHADGLNLTGLQRAVTGLARRARSNQLSPDDVQGGTFTLSNHGISGSLLATPIINQPQVGILGVGAVEKRVVVVSRDDEDSIAIKPMCYLSFTFDHRVLDGATADKFLARVKEKLENWR